MHRKPVPEPIERPQSVVSTSTNTTINDHDDTLSSVTTPRGGSPTHFEHANRDLPPPTYDESQAAYLENRGPPGAESSSQVLVYRTEINQHPYPPPLHPEENVYGVNDAFTTRDGSQEHPEEQTRPSALLYQALAFTNTPAPSLNENYVSHLTRPVAIPSLASSEISPSDSPVRFARLYSRVLQSTSITAAQFASFIDGLNAIARASSFSASNLHDSSSFRFSPSSDVPREEWVRAYIQLSNARFFAPRGLRMHITTLNELLELAKVPEHLGFRKSMCEIALNAAISGIGATGDEATRAASDVATALEPYVEPLSNMIPAMHRDSEAMEHIAAGLADFDLVEKERKQSASDTPVGVQADRPGAELERAITDPTGEQPRRKFWTPFGLGPISIGPIMPPPLPPMDRPRALDRSQTWQDWGQNFGRRMEKWGEEYGKEWEKWGEDYGKALEDWGNKLGKKFSGSSSPSKVSGQHKDGGASKESFLSGGSKSSGSTKKWKKDKDIDCRFSGKRDDEEQDWDDSASDVSSSSSSSSSSEDTWVEDPEAIFASKVVEIESMAEKARLAGKKNNKTIEKERGSALQKAEQERTKQETKIQNKVRTREFKRHVRQFKRQTRTWKRKFKRDLKQLRKSGGSAADMRDLSRRRMEEFHENRREWEQTKNEISQVRYESRDEWERRKAQRRADKQIRRQERREHRRGRWSRDGGHRRGRRGGRGGREDHHGEMNSHHGPDYGMGWHHGYGGPGPHHGHPMHFGPMGPVAPHMGPMGPRGRMGPLGHMGGPFGFARGHPFGRGRGGFGRGRSDSDDDRSRELDETPILKDENMLWIVIRNLE